MCIRDRYIIPRLGAIAQLGERLICIQEVRGSIPRSSTIALFDDEWELYKFVGTKFQKRSQEHQKKYLLNAYRVLLTRARQGLIIFVPEGDIQDKTRDPKFYDGTYEYLLKCGITEL